MNDPTTHGLSTSPTPAPPPKDIFEYVQQQWLAMPRPAPTYAMQDAVDEYIAMARKLLSKNQPVALDFTGASLSLRFQDGMILAVCNPEITAQTGGNAGSAPVSTPHPTPLDGKGTTVPSGSWGVSK